MWIEKKTPIAENRYKIANQGPVKNVTLKRFCRLKSARGDLRVDSHRDLRVTYELHTEDAVKDKLTS